MVDLPETIFEEAARAARSMEDSDTGLITVTRPGDEISEGLVAEILTMVANNTAHLSIPPPQVQLSSHRLQIWCFQECYCTVRAIPFLQVLQRSLPRLPISINSPSDFVRPAINVP